MTNQCPICNRASTLHHQLKNSPILQNIFFRNKYEAKNCITVDVRFYYCNNCLFLFNPYFNENNVVYDTNYNNDQLTSDAYQEYICDVSDNLALKCNMDSKSKILEVGCGNGFFLKKLMDATKSKHIVGYDPAYNDQYEMSDFIKKDYFTKSDDEYDVVILRHCFDSFVNNHALMEDISDSLTQNGRIYIEAASLNNILTTGNFTMLFHECHSYYSVSAISNTLKKFNLEIEQASPLFGNDYIGIIAKKSSRTEFDLESLTSKIKVHKNVVIWGVSGRAVSLLSQLSLGTELVKYGVDINTEKQGKYIPVTGQKIISPADVIKFNPDLVIISNEYYAAEIMLHFTVETKFVTFNGKFLKQPNKA